MECPVKTKEGNKVEKTNILTPIYTERVKLDKSPTNDGYQGILQLFM